ncbi:MAG: T9SS type A sorting domain-containing protein [Bacteroidetes bacterium]|nr:T9SS type A sorting domain-containing protein [Bacteroidota bacterium]
MKKQILHKLLLFLLFNILICATVPAQALQIVSTSSTPACGADGSATVNVIGGTPPYTYYWLGPNGMQTTPTNTLTGVGGGDYRAIVEDAAAGWVAQWITIPRPFLPVLTTTDDVCNGGIGAATVNVTGGNPPFSYLWSNGQSTSAITGLSAGVYEVTITDDVTGCYISPQMDSSLYAVIQNTSPVQLTTSSVGTTCANGQASVVATGGTAPYSYFWSTTPPQYTAIASGLNSGSYQVTVTDAVGCTATRWAWVSQLPNGITAAVGGTDETCLQANGSAFVTVSGGVPPYAYQWSNGTVAPAITNLSYGNYSVTITDAFGCTKIAQRHVARTEPLTLTLTETVPNCNNTGGAMSVAVTGGTSPYSYLWNNGQTTNSISNLSAGYHGLRVQDANGCEDYSYEDLELPQNCYGLVTGNIYGDMNANCTNDLGDLPFGGTVVEVGSSWVPTNYQGYYEEYVLPGSVTIEQTVVPEYFAVACPVAPGTITLPNVAAGTTYAGNDFYDQATSITSDLRVQFWSGPARPTAPQLVTIGYQNAGSTALNATVSFVHDPLMTLLNGGSNLTNYNPGTRTLTYNIGVLHPHQAGYLQASFSIPTNAVFGTPWSHTVEILPSANDVFPSDNSYTAGATVIAAYDPNRKTVVPEGQLQPDVDSLLTYTIEFQNTGNDTAFTVRLMDTLDADLDPLSIEVLGASHPFTWDIDAPGFLEFRFDHIMLPDSHINEPASHGWLMYRIKLKDNLPLGTQITNTASIYFDYNAPVVTNTTLNTFDLVAIDGPTELERNFSLYPNPAHQQVNVQLDATWSGKTEVRLLDLNGRGLRSFQLGPSQHHFALDVSDLPAGMYLVECINAKCREVQKLIVQ